jgi:hypothetical protein
MIPTVASLLKQSVADLLEFITVNAELQKSAAVKTAKGIIALVDVTGSESAAREALKKARVSDCTVKNAMQLVWAYDAVVRPGHADEKWFDELLYAHAVAVRQAIAKVGIVKVCEAKLFAKSAKANLIEFELLAETGLTRAERVAKDEADALAKIEADKKAADAAKKKAAETPAAPAKSGDAPPASEADVAGLVVAKGGDKGKKTVVEQFDAVIGAAEKFLAAVVPEADDVTLEALKTRAAAMLVKLDAAVKARDVSAKKSA